MMEGGISLAPTELNTLPQGPEEMFDVWYITVPQDPELINLDPS